MSLVRYLITHMHTHTHTHLLLYLVALFIHVQALKNLVNTSRQRIQQLFTDLDRRLKSADKKDQSTVIGEGRADVHKKQKTKTTGNRHPDNDTSSTTTTVSVQ